MKFRYITIAAVLYIIVSSIMMIFKKGDYNNYQTSSGITQDGHSFIVIHNYRCNRYKPLFKGFYDKKDYIKKVYEVYCPYCISDEDAYVLNTYSNANIINIGNNTIEYDSEWKNVDRSNRTFETYKGWIEGESTGIMYDISGEKIKRRW